MQKKNIIQCGRFKLTPQLLNNISSTNSKSRPQSQNLRPTRTVQASDPTRTRVRHSILLHPFYPNCAGHLLGTRPELVQDSGRDNHCYESFLVVEVGPTRDVREPGALFNSYYNLEAHTACGRDIIYNIIFYRYLYKYYII